MAQGAVGSLVSVRGAGAIGTGGTQDDRGASFGSHTHGGAEQEGEVMKEEVRCYQQG